MANGRVGRSRICSRTSGRWGSKPGGHDALKTAPRGYPKDHPRIDLLRNKGLVSWRQWPPGAWLGKPGAKVRVVEFLRASRPLNDWLEANVGPSTLEQPRSRLRTRAAWQHAS